jgi:deoxyribonuclease V
MHLALDVQYGDSRACGACVGFEDPVSSEPAFVLVEAFQGAPAPYVPGRFRERELPYLNRLVTLAGDRCALVEAIIIDGFVWLGENRPGLGLHLHEALGSRTPVIGVAKTPFKGAPGGEIRRGRSVRPLFVTSVGLDQREAENLIRSMHGEHRIPTLLKLADRASRDPSRWSSAT